jgi:hypothetical protein
LGAIFSSNRALVASSPVGKASVATLMLALDIDVFAAEPASFVVLAAVEVCDEPVPPDAPEALELGGTYLEDDVD